MSASLPSPVALQLPLFLAAVLGATGLGGPSNVTVRLASQKSIKSPQTAFLSQPDSSHSPPSDGDNRNNSCYDSPVGWKDSHGYNCRSYAESGYCTSSGDYGPGWYNLYWGTFGHYASDGHTAVTACCACGGGNRRREPVGCTGACAGDDAVPPAQTVTKHATRYTTQPAVANVTNRWPGATEVARSTSPFQTGPAIHQMSPAISTQPQLGNFPWHEDGAETEKYQIVVTGYTTKEHMANVRPGLRHSTGQATPTRTSGDAAQDALTAWELPSQTMRQVTETTWDTLSSSYADVSPVRHGIANGIHVLDQFENRLGGSSHVPKQGAVTVKLFSDLDRI